jgi:diguanylate cyclase (GGDEF)-like protein/PAS domain S-box-containing protein
MNSTVSMPPIAFPGAEPGSGNEDARLTALRRLRILDTPPSESFDRVTRLAAAALGVPIVLMSLVDERRQWFKSRVGLEASETPRDISFCSHAVAQRRPLVVADATKDQRFATNPLVTGAPNVRFYAGVPVYTHDRHAIGTLCAIDRQPRELDEESLNILRDCALLIEDLVERLEFAVQTEGVLELVSERERLFTDTFEQAAVGILHTSLAGHLLRINRCASQMLGYSAGELELKSFQDITHPEDVDGSNTFFNAMRSGGMDHYRIEKRYRRKNGTEFWANVTAALQREQTGVPGYVITVIEDISARKQVEADLLHARDSLQQEVASQTQRLSESNDILRVHVAQLLDSERTIRHIEHRLRTIADNVPAFIGYWDRELRCEFANEAYTKAFGYTTSQMVGLTMMQVLGEAGFNEVETYARRALEGRSQQFERAVVQSDGVEAFFEIRFIPDRDLTDEILGFFVQATETTTSRNVQLALEAANARLTNTTTTDYLTGLANRSTFSGHGAAALARLMQGGEAFGLILLDLDNFSNVNVVHGFDAGDEVLRVVARILKGQLRNHHDSAARLGGAAFAVLCFGELDEELLQQMSEGIRALLEREIITGAKGPIQVTASVGCTLGSTRDTEWRNVVMRADAALYAAKSGGKNGVSMQLLV